MKVLRSLLEVGVALVLLLALLRWTVGFFKRKTTLYEPSALHQLSLLAWPVLAVVAGVVAAGPNLLLGTALERGLAWGLLGAVLALAAPALLLHLRYYTRNAATALRFDPGQGVLQVALHGELAYDAARQGWPGPGPVVWGRSRWGGVFWRRYEYLRLPLPQGELLLTTLVMPDMQRLVDYLRHFGVPVQEQRTGWPWA